MSILDRSRRATRLTIRLAVRAVVWAFVVFLTAIVFVAYEARHRPDLQAWHTIQLESEYTRRHKREVPDFKAYLENEQRLFDELQERVVRDQPDTRMTLNRYRAGSRSNPQRGAVNYNRTSVSIPDSPGGAVLLLHGMSDGPYSMRHLQALFEANGFFVLNLRLPGHGTTPGELARVHWRDWMGAVKLAADRVIEVAGEERPFWIVGYSNGGALALKYALDGLESGLHDTPDQLILLSPMIGVSPLASISRWFTWLGGLDYFEKALWLDLLPEYDPHKYNSFPNNGPKQSRLLTREIQAQMKRLKLAGRLGGLPPILAFQSLADATVDTRAVFTQLYAELPANGSELVMFDINRLGDLDQFVNPAIDALKSELLQADRDNYSLSLVVNHDEDTQRIAVRHKEAGSDQATQADLDLEWPANFFSLSHVALPFPPDDPIYGYQAPAEDTGFPWLGWVNWLGESGALTLPASVYTRARSNPFYPYIEERISGLIAQDRKSTPEHSTQ